MARGFSTTLGVGTTDVVTTGTCPAANIRTYSIWYNGRVFTGSPRLWYDANQMLQFNVSPFQLLFTRGFSTTSGVWLITGGSQATTGVWNHFVISFDNSSTADPVAWINGQPATVAVSTAPVGTANAIATSHNIGNRSAQDRVFDGLLGDFALWNGVALTQAQVLALYKGARPDRIARSALAEWIDLQSGRPVSRAGRAPPSLVGTKIRPDSSRYIWPMESNAPFGGFLLPVTATFNVTELSDSISASAAATVAASSDVTEAADGLSAAAAAAIAAAASLTESPDTIVASASAQIGAALALIEAPDGVTASATSAISALLNIAERPDAVTGSASVAVAANAAMAEALDLIAAAAASGVTASAAFIEATDTLIAAIRDLADLVIPASHLVKPAARVRLVNPKARVRAVKPAARIRYVRPK